jgi:uncharacterized protein YbaP (TraB family)
MLDSGNKGCENKGMRFKLLFKWVSFTALSCLVLTFLLSLAPVRLSADQQPDADSALFWSIQKNGQMAGYLLGTIHSEDARVLDFSENFLGKLKANHVFAMELVPDMSTLERLNQYMHYPPGQTLQSVMGDESFRALASALSTYRLTEDFINTMKPWAAMMTLSTPPPETGFFMDLSLSLRASGNGLEIVGLETLEQQLSFLEDMPIAMQLSLLDQAIDEFDRVNEVHDQMVSAYLENDLFRLEELTDEQLKAVGGEASDYFMKYGIRERNLRMAESLLSQLERNTVFVAVGALHLPGEDGLINLLRVQGFELQPLAMPFSTVSAASK